MNVHRPGDPTPEAVRRLITRHCAGCGADVRLSPTDEQARSAAIRRSVLHTRPLSSRELADYIVKHLPRNPERSMALRKLLEAKDAAVRAVVAKP